MVVSGPWGPGNTQQWREWTFPDMSFDDMVPMICKSLRGKPVGPWVSVDNESWDAEPYVHPPMRESGYDPGDEDFTHLKGGFIAGKQKGYQEGLLRGFQKGKAKGKGFIAQTNAMAEQYGLGFDEGYRQGKGSREGKGKGSRRKGKGKGNGKSNWW